MNKKTIENTKFVGNWNYFLSLHRKQRALWKKDCSKERFILNC